MEIELKLTLAPLAMRRLISSPLWSIWRTADARNRLSTLYFDTPEGDLLREGVALRVRRSGRQWIQTVKGGGSALGGLHRRTETECAVGGPRPELAKVPAELLKGALADPALPARLRQVFETRFERLARTVYTSSGAVIEVAFDRGSVIAGALASPICEVELELKAGQASDLLALARAVVREGAWLDDTSKAARGYRLAWPERAGARAPVAARSAPASKPRDWHQLLVGAVASGLAHLHGNAAGVRDKDVDPEYIHQMRVATRRLRTVLTIARRQSDHPLASHLLVETAWLGRCLGPARDWDVMLGETLPAYIAAHGTPSGHTRLLADIGKARQAAHQVAADAAASVRYGELVLDLLAWLELPAPEESRKAAAPARQELARCHRKVLRLGQPELLVDDEARHRLRLACKKLRYTAESLAPAFGARAVDRYVAALAQLQKSLGGLNDAAVATMRLDSLPAGRAEVARRAIKRQLRQAALQKLETLSTQWQAFTATRPFWER